ncbi:urea ABC transporter ATP-binding protein UrtD [Ectothiorhodospiraceae bacterium WFHF3C12]|nr:urea ABC transporter ATP-binding protein UrtD [Ectothiorhodospiraceae bacterium WFHF3C12]
MSAILDLKGLEVSFDGFKAVSGLDLSVGEGELLCLLGANGAGKSTTLDLICGKTLPTAGTIRFRDRDITEVHEFRRARLGIGRKFQVPTVFRELTVEQNLEVARSEYPGVLSTLRRLGVRRCDRLEEVLELVGLTSKRRAQASELSHGETQWLEIAMLVMQDSQLILMDEPTAGMTIAETSRTCELFNRLRGRHTLVVVEHDMSFVREIAERITVMHQGQVLAEGGVTDIENNEAVREAYLGSRGIAHA